MKGRQIILAAPTALAPRPNKDGRVASRCQTICKKLELI